jgi:autotransporter-associated beta strand protein
MTSHLQGSARFKLLCRPVGAFILAIAFGIAVQPAAAANKFWVGASGDTNNPTSGTWQTTTPTVWSDGTVATANAGWTAGDAALFGGADGAYAIQVAAAISASNLNFSASGYALTNATAQTVTLTARGTSILSVASGKTVTIGTNVTLACGVSNVTIGASAGGAAGGTIVFDSGTFTKSANASTVINGAGTVVSVRTGSAINTSTGTSSYLSVGNSVGDNATLSVDGGTVSIRKNSASIWVPNNTAGNVQGTFNLNAGSVGEIGGFFAIGVGSGNVGTLNLNGGTLTVNALTGGNGVGVAGAGTSIANFNGGTLKPYNGGNGSQFMMGLTGAYVRNGGLILDNNTYALTITQSLLHSTNVADAAIDGGLTTLNSGVLTLAGTNTYTGPTVVQAGTLAFTNFGSISSSSALNINNATLDLTAASKGLALSGTLALSNATIGLPVAANSRTNLVVATLATSGSTNTINVTSFDAYGNWPVSVTLIKYGSLAAGVVDANNNLINLGVNLPTNGNLAGYLSNNTTKQSIDLVITSGDGRPSFAANPPASANRYAGSTLQLTASAVRAIGNYQWRKNGTPLSDDAHLSGSVGPAGAPGFTGTTTTTLTISNLTSADVGNYDVAATNSYGSAISTPTVVAIVTPAADYESFLTTNTPRPAAYYRFNETSDTLDNAGLPAYDYAGGFDAVYGMAVLNSFYGVVGPQPADGLPGFETGNGAAQFSYGYPGSTVTVSNGWPVNTNTVTLTAWIYPASAQVANAGLIMNRGATVAGLSYSGATDANGNYTLGYTWHNESGTYGWDSKLVPPLNQWSLVALVVTPTNATIYVGNTNGLASSVHTYNHVVLNLAGLSMIGYDSYNAPARGFNGSMDEVAVFGQALSSDQVLSILAVAVGTNQFTPVPSALGAKTAVIGDTVQWTEVPQGTGPFSYQWMGLIDGSYVNLTDDDRISGSQTGTLTISNLVTTDPTSYMVAITNLVGGAVGGPGTLTILTTRPVITLTAADAASSSSFAAAGHWSDNNSPAPLNDYADDSLTLRTPADANSYTFAGHSLTLRSSSGPGLLALKGSSGADVYTIGTSPATGLILDGGWVSLWVGSGQTVVGYITMTANGGNFDPENCSPMTIAAQISGVGCLREDANGPLGGKTVLSAANTYTGGTLIDAADTLQLSGTGTLGSTTASFGIINTNNKGYGMLDLNGTSQTIGNLYGTGGTIFNSSAASSSTLIVGNGNTGDGNFAGSIASGAGILGLTKVGTGTITLSGTNSYSGPTLISGGTLALSGAATLSGTPVISVAQNATLDVSGLASPLSLASGQALAGSGPTCAVNGSVNLNAGSLVLNYSGTPALTVNGATLALNNNVLTVTNLGAPLANGSYKLVAKGSGSVVGAVDGSAVTVAVGGVATGSRASLSISDGELYLSVAPATPPTAAISVSGGNVSVTWSGSGILLQATNVSGPWVTNVGATSPFKMPTTNAQMFFRLQQP